MLILLLSMHGIPGPAPKPPAAHYRIVTKTTSEVDLSAMGQPSQSVVMVTSAFVSITVTDSAAGRIAHIIVDSSSFDAGPLTSQMPPEMTASARGTVFHAFVVNGHVMSQLTPVPASLQAAQAVNGLELLLAGLRTTKAGDTWVDTMKTDTTMSEGAAKGSRISTWTAKAGDGGAIQFDATWTGTTTVKAPTGQIDMKMSGTSTILTAAGQLARSVSSLGIGSAAMAVGGMSIPMKVTTEVTGTPMP
jgi:hypothetical protein